MTVNNIPLNTCRFIAFPFSFAATGQGFVLSKALISEIQLGPNMLINFKQVQYMNSCGVRAWINFLRELENNRKIIFEECTPEIMSQINMIPNFKSSAHIRSLYAPVPFPKDLCTN